MTIVVENPVFSSAGTMTEENGPPYDNLEDFRNTLFSMQNVRRRIATSLLAGKPFEASDLQSLRDCLNELCDNRTAGEMRHITTGQANFPINIRDEIRGLQKDVSFLSRLFDADGPTDSALGQVDLAEVLAPFHPEGKEKFFEEMDKVVSLLTWFTEGSDGRKPFFITDWDGTMKDYCSQYATNLQPVYSALVMGRFSGVFTRATAVLTAGPLRGPGILDLTALPINGPVLFSGSWGREWWLKGKRVVHDGGITDEGYDALQRLNDEMTELLHDPEFAQFALVGSGVQRKVDRLTLGVQTVFGHVSDELSARYVDAVRERIHRVDPNNLVLGLKIDDHNPLEIEIFAQPSNDGEERGVWDKSDGVEALLESLGDSIDTDKVLVAGDTASDVPMLRHVVERNEKNASTIFVGAGDALKASVRSLMSDSSRICFVACPDVVHAAFARIIASRFDID